MTINFANNRLGGQAKRPEGYETCKTRVVVTVGMMTTGYDCQDLLNVALMRPVFSPSDFVQMKGRGTRKWIFEYVNYSDIQLGIAKEKFKLFDYFATCEYFENDFDYDEKIKLPKPSTGVGVGTIDGGGIPRIGEIDLSTADEIATVNETSEGVIMRIDREGFKTALNEDVLSNTVLKTFYTDKKNKETEVPYKPKTKRSISDRLKVKVLIRDGNKCKLCGITVIGENIHFDHIKPWSKGGETIFENIQVLCAKHNLAKGNYFCE
jgi:hypothetical protein